MAGMGAAPSWLARAAEGAGGKRKILVAIFQRGAADGLNIVVPFADKRYHELRPTIGIPAPRAANGPGPFNSTAIDLDGHFALNPALQPLKALWDKEQLAIVEATGSPDPTRSHFDAQDQMESGTPGKTSGDGWLNRALPPPGPETSPVRAVADGGAVASHHARRSIRHRYQRCAAGPKQWPRHQHPRKHVCEVERSAAGAHRQRCVRGA